MASEKIDALELEISAKLTTNNLDKLIDSLNKLGKTIEAVNAQKLYLGIKETGDSAKTATVKVDGLTNSFLNQTIRITALIAVFRKLSGYISDGIADSMTYIKTLNMFNVSLGEYAENASKYGNTVREAMGIDIAGWQKAQGIFETLIKGFGVGGDQAAYMSQQLTQLSYDIASYYDLTTEEAQNKIKSALSGRIEPIRKLGWDISQGKLVDIASNPENYGITTYYIDEETGAIKANTQAVDDNTEHMIVNFNQLTQAEKVQLRYIALMTEVTEVQGNMGKTLHDPANQMKIFKEQTAMTARALGNIFIPAINEVLPYLTAFARKLEEVFQDIANFFGFEIPDMSDRIGVADEVDYYDDIVEATGSAASNAKKLKDYMIGIDELNVLRPDDTGAGGGASGGEQSNLSGLLMPGYDFLSSAIESRVKEAKEQLDKLFADWKEHPLQLPISIFVEGAGTLGEKFWTWVFGKTPEELAEEAAANGRTVGQQFILEYIRTIGKVGMFYVGGAEEIGSWIWSLILGKTPEELAEEAGKYGVSVGDMFILRCYLGMKKAVEVYKNILAAPGSAIMSVLFGSPDELGARAAEAGRTVGEQFMLEFAKKIAEIFESNPVLQEVYKIITGRDIEADLETINRKISGSSGRVQRTGTKPENRNTNANGTQRSGSARTTSKPENRNSDANAARKTAEATANAYIDGWKSKVSDIKETAKNIYDTIFKGVNDNGNGTASMYQSGANLSISYVDGLSTGKVEANNAGKELFNSGYNGANDNGQGAQKYNDIAEGMSRLFASALGSKESKDRAYDAAYSMANEGSWGAYDVQEDFEWTGDQAGRGYILGIMAHKLEAEAAGETVANATLATLKEALGIASPSKEAYEVGKYFVEGFTNAIKDFSGKAAEAANDMAEKSVKAAKISNNMFGGFSVPTSNNAGYNIGAMNNGAMASLASNMYQAVVSGMSAVALADGDRDVKIIIDGKEIFNVVQSESRKRGVAISNGAFST